VQNGKAFEILERRAAEECFAALQVAAPILSGFANSFLRHAGARAAYAIACKALGAGVLAGLDAPRPAAPDPVAASSEWASSEIERLELSLRELRAGNAAAQSKLTTYLHDFHGEAAGPFAAAILVELQVAELKAADARHGRAPAEDLET
jgi:hypothetical protein